ncbi:MAG TPA: hypothetical protein HA277_04265 [Methanosphaera sp.]|nr:hypothetical protein [Methanosphaera sp.]HIJ15599.1 hypothetical protein [Methanosphaera sp.]
MTLIINIVTPEGIIMASDSRQSERNIKEFTRISTNSANKLFSLNDKVIVGTAGLAFFADNTGIRKNVSEYIESFKKDNKLDLLTVEEIATKLQEYINKHYPWEKQLDISAQQLEIEAKQNGDKILSLERRDDSIDFKIKQPSGRIREGHLNIEPVNLLVSGYNSDGTTQTYEINSPGEKILKRENNEFGCTWIGQGDVVSRLILGYDSKLFKVPIIKAMGKKADDDLRTQIRGLEYFIQWSLITLQDAVDLAVFLIKSTSVMQRFADGISMDVGDIQGVGGPIDVALITKDGIKWINKKEITYSELI